jgi:hypothetical protein
VIRAKLAALPPKGKKMYLEVAGRKLALKKPSSKRLPKRNCTDLEIKLDGAKYVAKVTNNAAWAADATKTLEYIWVEISGVAYYATLEYAEKAESLKGAKFVAKDGVAPKPVPRLTADRVREEKRIAEFRKTWYANREGAVEVAEPAPEAETTEI